MSLKSKYDFYIGLEQAYQAGAFIVILVVSYGTGTLISTFIEIAFHKQLDIYLEMVIVFSLLSILAARHFLIHLQTKIHPWMEQKEEIYPMLLTIVSGKCIT